MIVNLRVGAQMNKINSFTLMCAVLLLNMQISEAFTESDIVVYHNAIVDQMDDSPEEFPLFPEEPDIDGFPSAIDDDETDLDVLQNYYINVANAYEKWGRKFHMDAVKAMDRMKQAQAKLHWGQIRLRDKAFTRNVHYEARTKLHRVSHYNDGHVAQSIGYLKTQWEPAAKKAQLAARKEKFYRNLAMTWKEMADNVINE